MIDLHAHTDRSDGSSDPADLVCLAVHEGIEALGIADHDTLAGYDAAIPFAAEAGLELVCAVELSTRPSEPKLAGKRQPSVHLLGYWLLAPPSAEFRCWLESQQASRRQRNVELVARLEQLGVPVSLNEAGWKARSASPAPRTPPCPSSPPRCWRTRPATSATCRTCTTSPP